MEHPKSPRLALALGVGFAFLGCGGPRHTSPEDPTPGVDGFGFGPVVSPDGGPPACSENPVIPSLVPRAVDVLILFDRSGSMSAAFGSGTRYSVEAGLLDELLPVYEDKIQFGFAPFPASRTCNARYVSKCCAEKPTVAIGPKNAAPILRQVAAAYPPDGNTPTAEALALARESFLASPETGAERFVLLSTDGRPSCTGEGQLPDDMGQACMDALREVDRLAAGGVKVIVLGVGPGLELDPGGRPSCLEELARRGGVSRGDGKPALFSASDPVALERALQQIFGGVIRPSCTFELKLTPSNSQAVRVYVGGRQVPRNATDGWDYESPADIRRITLHGSACKRLETFQATSVVVKFGCPPCLGRVSCD